MLVGSVFLAAILATQQSRFESLIREKPPQTSAATLRLAAELRAGQDIPIDLADLERLYSHWLVAEELPAPQIAQTLTEANPAWFHDRVERTLVAGNTPQRLRALQLIDTTTDKALIPTLQRALSRYENMGPGEAIPPCRETLRRLSGGGGH